MNCWITAEALLQEALLRFGAAPLKLVGTAGVQPATLALGVPCSMRLSYVPPISIVY